jgi:hypothetical protein
MAKLKSYRVILVATVEIVYDVEAANKGEAKEEAIGSLEARVIPQFIDHWAGDITVKSVESRWAAGHPRQ